MADPVCEPSIDATKMESLKSNIKWLYYQYELLTALYMLEPWEKFIFNSIILSGFVLAFITSYFYFPEYFQYSLLVFTQYFPSTEAYFPRDFLNRLKASKVATFQ